MRVLVVAAAVLVTGSGWAVSPHLVSTEMGRDAPVGIYAVVRRDCSVGAAPDIRITRAPAHGIIVIEDIRLAAPRAEPCTAVLAPARRIVYRPAAGFSGRDEVVFEIVDRDTGQSDTHPVTVVVQPAPTGI